MPVNNEEVVQTATNNTLDKFQLGIKKILEDIMIKRMADNDDLVTKYMDDKEFRDVVFPLLSREIYERIVDKETE